MMNPRLILSRRLILGALMLVPAGAYLLRGANPAHSVQAALDAMDLPFAPARLDLIELAHDRKDGRDHLEAVVRLTWTPGTRQDAFTAEGADTAQALAALVDNISGQFSTLT